MAWEATGVGQRLRVRNDEGRLVRGAAAGEGRAIAALYRRYEDRLFNLALRISGDEDRATDATREAFLAVLGQLPATPDRERLFSGQLLAAVRDASYDAMEKRRVAEQADGERDGGDGQVRVEATPDDDESPLLEDWQEEIHAANARLPAQQREVLALREPGALSYGEVAQIMQLDHHSVAELIATARIGLHDELRGTDLAAEPLASEDCGHALPLMAMRDDWELAEDSDDGGWLIEHLVACHGCRAYLDAMQEARLSYSAWEPVAAPARLYAETMAGAALVRPGDGPGGAEAATTEVGGEGATRALSRSPSADERLRRRRREVLLAGGWGAVVLVGLLAVLVGGVFDNAEGEDRPSEPSLDSPARVEPPAAPAKPARRKRAKKREAESELPSRPRPVVQQPAQRAPVVVVAPRAREQRRAAPPPRTRRQRPEQPRATPLEPGPAPQQQAPRRTPAPGVTAPTAPTTPAPQEPPNARCPNPGGQPVPC